MEWMVKDFDAQTKEKAGGRTRVLLMDGHSSHYTRELLTYAKANNIVILAYPPHCTHALQGLDVVCFARMKEVAQDIDAETHLPYNIPQPSSSSQSILPTTPQHRHTSYSSKRIRLMTTALSGTSSGSFLVSKARITSNQTVAPPSLERSPYLHEPEWPLLGQPQTCILLGNTSMHRMVSLRVHMPNLSFRTCMGTSLISLCMRRRTNPRRIAQGCFRVAKDVT